MDIIEFLMRNIYFVIIVLFFLFRFMSKAGGGGKKPGRMPDFGGGEGPADQSGDNGSRRNNAPATVQRSRQNDRSAERQEQQSNVYRSQFETAKESRRDEYNDRLRASAQASVDGRYTSQSSAAQADRSRRVSANADDDSAIISKVTANDLQKAVIWSEILGPPRAKRGFRR